MPKISRQQLEQYFAGAVTDATLQIVGKDSINNYSLTGNRYSAYIETVLQYHPLKIHADGDFPKAMIEDRRPSESAEILEYRKRTYKAITKLPISKVLTSLTKIRRSPDWNIKFDTTKVPAKIIEKEKLENYCADLPGCGSFTDWIFGNLLKQNAIDANAIIAVIPLKKPTGNEYYKPVPIIFNSDHVLLFEPTDQMCILQSRKKINLLLNDGSYKFAAGLRFYYIDDIELIIYDQVESGFIEALKIKHKLGEMPAFKVKGEAYKQYDNITINRSRLDPMVAFLDEAACEYSDYKGSKVQHLFPLFFVYLTKDCDACNGNGEIPGDPTPVKCSACHGGGKVKFSPFAHMELEPPKLGEQALPGDPAGYIKKDTAILELQDKSVDKNNYKALSAVNMQFLDQTPLHISGEAKNVDREELQNFVYNFAEDLIGTADKTVYYMNEWRYSIIVPDKEERMLMLPKIPVPQNFDLLPSSYLIDEITKAKTGKVHPYIIAQLEKQLAEKKFYNEPDLAVRLMLYFDLDPLPGISIEEKMQLIQNQAITKKDFVVSTYLASFIKQAMIADTNFENKKYAEQMAEIEKLADAKIKQTDDAALIADAAKQKIIDEMNAGAGGK